MYIILEANDLEKENKKLEDYISEMKNYCAMIEKTKQENDYLQMVYDKNVSTISSEFIIVHKNIFKF